MLAEEGFTAFGVNAIARRAGCDKQLIYRYFGGLDGLVEAIGEDVAGLIQSLMGEADVKDLATYVQLVEHMLLSLLDALRRSDLLLRVAAWEVFDPTPVTARLAAARGRALGAWVEARRGDLVAPDGVDFGAINATLIAAVQQLALSAKATGTFGGVSLQTEADWDRIRAVLRKLVQSAYVTG